MELSLVAENERELLFSILYDVLYKRTQPAVRQLS
jgi:hypothetical protein